MKKLEFKSNRTPTVGIEIELALVDAESMALTSSFARVREQVPERYQEAIKQELMQCYLEINTGVCRTIGEAERDLSEKIAVVERACDQVGVRTFWGATHPFSCWKDQKLTPNERYQRLQDLLQDMARQLVTFGLHVHVGVDSGDKAIMICDRILPYLPVLLAVSANSPFWDNRVTGLQSSRSKVMEGLPTAGLPTPMRNWSEYTWLINHLVQTGFINTIREIWWDVRPHHNFGTVEVRMCDMPGNLHDVLGLAAFIQCLVVQLSDEVDEGTYVRDPHPMLVRQNKWRAARFGPRARLVESFGYEQREVPAIVEDTVRKLWPVAERLDCQEYLHRILGLASGPSWADRQLQILTETGDPAAVVRQFSEQARLTKAAADLAA